MEGSKKPVLKTTEVHVSYGHGNVLNGISIEVMRGEFVALIGPNGSGKSTLLKAIMGLLKMESGAIEFLGQDITKQPTEKRVASGMAIVPEGRGILPLMSVRENLLLGQYYCKKPLENSFDAVFRRFPVLEERMEQFAGTLSGGQQQMVTISRALLSNPSILILDEPSLGLAPIVVTELFESIKEIQRERNISILLSEQNANKALEIAERAYVLELGKIRLSGTSEDLKNDSMVRNSYLGLP